jgi:hypothetical protein
VCECKPLLQTIEQATVQVRTFRSGVDELPDGEELEYDPTAYHMYHSLRLVACITHLLHEIHMYSSDFFMRLLRAHVYRCDKLICRLTCSIRHMP